MLTQFTDAYMRHEGEMSFNEVQRYGYKVAKHRDDHGDVIKWIHFLRYWPFVREIHRSRVNSLHKAQWREASVFSLICAWVNNREAGDLRRHRAHYDVIVMTRERFLHYHWSLVNGGFPTLKASNALAEWRSGSVSALPCERPGFASRTRLREIIPANNCTMQGQNNWGNWGSSGVMKLWVAWEVLRWLMKFRELCSGGFHPKLVTPPYHGFLNVNTPPNSQNSKRH